MEKKGSTAVKIDTKEQTGSLYNVSELAANAKKVFGENVRKECVVAAFKHAGKIVATKDDAKKIIAEFLKKEVK